jgi:hypothetical protein
MKNEKTRNGSKNPLEEKELMKRIIATVERKEKTKKELENYMKNIEQLENLKQDKEANELKEKTMRLGLKFMFLSFKQDKLLTYAAHATRGNFLFN